MTDGLLPCPFCGCNSKTLQEKQIPWGAIQQTTTEWWYIQCSDCHAKMDYPSKDGVIKKWNTRTQPTDSTVRETAGESSIRAQAVGNVFKMRGSFDAPGFDACVEAEIENLTQHSKSSDVSECDCECPYELKEQPKHGPDYWSTSQCPICSKELRNGQGCYSHMLNVHKIPVREARRILQAAKENK